MKAYNTTSLVSAPPADFNQPMNLPSYQWLDRHHNQATIKRSSELLFCLTLYNEKFSELLSTLITITQSAKHAIDQGLCTEQVTVCVVCDGIDRLDESVNYEATSLGWIGAETRQTRNSDGLHIFSSTFIPAFIPSLINDTGLDLEDTCPIKLEFCVKPQNHGKLDSHWWFFNQLCKKHDPKICFQIDAGTKLKQDTLKEMLRGFNSSPDIAALASNVIIQPKSTANILENFQCADFITQRSSLWTAEKLSGYMSVVPGQFCGMRWSALAKKNSEGLSPVDRYLKGMECQSAHEKIMFLAEDRVMCYELLTDPENNNTIEFSTAAECYTDTCTSVDELLKQRRRWINSAFACRSWMLYKFAGCLTQPELSVKKKIRLGTSMVSMSWSLAMEYFQPLISLLLLFLTFSSASYLSAQHDISASITYAFYGFILISWLAPTVLSLSGWLQKLSRSQTNTLLWCAASASVLALVTNLTASLEATNPSRALAAFLPIYLTIISLLSSAFLTRNTFKYGIKTSYLLYLAAMPLNLMLFTYAFFNLKDSSWGTKGLDNENCTYAAKSIHLKKELATYANKFLLTWLIVNLASVSAIIYFQITIVALQSIAIYLCIYIGLGLIGAIISSKLFRSNNNESHQNSNFARNIEHIGNS